MRKGSISIISIFMFLIIIMLSMFTIYIYTIQYSITASSIDNIQSNNITENKLNEMIYDKECFDEYLLPIIIQKCRGNRVPSNGIWKIDFKNNPNMSNNLIESYVEFEDIDNRLNMILDIRTEYNNIEANLKAWVPVMKEIFELEQPILTQSKLDFEYNQSFLELMKLLEKEIWEHDCSPTSSVRKFNSDKDMIIIMDRIDTSHNMINPLNDKKELLQIYNDNLKELHRFTTNIMLINLKSNEENKSALIIGEEYSPRNLKMQGVLYIEGDLVINQKFEFNGLIIINNGNIIINTYEKPTINGMILHKGDLEPNEQDYNLNYDSNLVRWFCTYIPGAFNPEIQLIKKYW